MLDSQAYTSVFIGHVYIRYISLHVTLHVSECLMLAIVKSRVYTPVFIGHITLHSSQRHIPTVISHASTFRPDI